jgi:hypothetical protein
MIEGNYRVKRNRDFSKNTISVNEYLSECVKWAAHPGQHFKAKGRALNTIIMNSILGKMGEFGLYKYFLSLGHELDRPELKIRSKGQWDTYDLLLQGKKIQVKSSSYKGNLLLLKKDDWDNEGNYKYTVEGENNDPYSYFIFCRIKPSFKDLIPDDQIYTEEKILETLSNVNFRIDIAGFINMDDFKKAIKDDKCLGSNCRINDAFNISEAAYYFDAGELREIGDIDIETPKKNDRHRNYQLFS